MSNLFNYIKTHRIITVVVVLLLIVLLVLFLLNLNNKSANTESDDKLATAVIKIDNLSQYSKNISSLQLYDVSLAISKTLAVPGTKPLSANIRDSSLTTKNIGQSTVTNYIIDIPDQKQSYQIEDSRSSNQTSGEVYTKITCPDQKNKIYSDTECKAIVELYD